MIINAMIASPVGTPVLFLRDIIQLEYARGLNRVGQFSVQLPDMQQVRDATQQRGMRLIIYLQPQNGAPSIDFAGFIHTVKTIRSTNGLKYIDLSGPDLVNLLNRRIVASNEDETEATISDFADDAIKQLVRDQFLAATTYRSSTYNVSSDQLSVDADQSLGATVAINAAFNTVLELCQLLADASAQVGTRVYFDVTQGPAGKTNISTYIGSRGVDRRGIIINDDGPTVFSSTTGINYAGEITRAYAIGGDLGDNRVIVSSTDDNRALSGWANTIETSVNASSSDPTVDLEGIAQRVVYQGRPQLIATFDLESSPPFIYRDGLQLGDLIRINAAGVIYDAQIDSVKVNLSAGGHSIDYGIEVLEQVTG